MKNRHCSSVSEMLVALVVVSVLVAHLGDVVGAASSADFKVPIVTANNNILTFRLPAEPGVFSKISLHMDLDNPVAPPQQGGIATVDLLPAQFYKRSFWEWQGDSGKGQYVDLRGKTLYYWVRAEDKNGLGINSEPKQVEIQ